MLPKNLLLYATFSSATSQEDVPADARSKERQGSSDWPVLDKALSYVVLTCGIITLFVGTYQILSSHSTVPIWDEWQEIDAISQAPNHMPPLPWLWSQHNEHRILFYRLLLLADIHVFHGNHWVEFAAILCAQIASLFLLMWFLRRSGMSKPFCYSVIGLSAFCLFCPSQWENFLWAIQIVVFLPSFFLLISLLGLMSYLRSAAAASWRWLYLVLSILAASGATYGFGNGVVVWPLLILLAILAGLRLRVVLLYLISGFILISSYLFHYASPARSSAWQSVRHPLAILGYVTRLLGVILPPWMRLRDGVAVSTGTFGVLAALVIAVWLLKSEQRRNPIVLVMFGLMFYSLATAGINGVGRMGIGMNQAFVSRYQTYNLLFWLSLVTLWLFKADGRIPSLRRPLLVLVTLCMIAAGWLVFPLCVKASHLAVRRSEAAALTLLAGVPDKDALAVLYPDPVVPWRDADYFRLAGLFMFSDLRYQRIDKPVDSIYRIGTPDLCAGEVNMVERVPQEELLSGQTTSGLRISGWAVDKPREKPVNKLLIAADGQIVGFALGGLHLGSNGNKTFLKQAKFVDWSGSARLPEATTIEVYAVDPAHSQLCLIAKTPIPRN